MQQTLEHLHRLLEADVDSDSVLALAEHLPLGVFVLRADGTVRFANKAAASLSPR